MRGKWWVVGLVVGLSLTGCGSGDGGGAPAESSNGGSGGSAGTGGVAGAANSGGMPAAGGNSGTGGTNQGGGAPGSGGAGVGGGAGQSTFHIGFDYRFDTMNTFTPERKAALEAAGRIWEGFILSEFEDVPAGTALACRDPKTPDASGVAFTVDYAIDDVAVFVAFTTIDNVGNALALSSFSFNNQVTDAALLARLHTRLYESPFQPWVGETAYDATEPWFFDSTPETEDDIPPTSDDFIGVALHEIGHLLGVGHSPAFVALIQNGTFTGAHAVAVNGGPVLLDPDGAHIDPSVLTGGQPSLMDSSTPYGVRQRPTALDLAILEDLGYKIAH